MAIERQRRKSSQSVTIRDVAAHVGVSPMTVSRVINRESNVKPETRELVHAAMRELNYAPSPAARSLAGSIPCRIGLLYDNPSTGYLGELLLGALDESSRTGAQILVERCGESELAAAALGKLLKTGIDGLILTPPLCEAERVLAEVQQLGVVAVLVAVGHASERMATVRIDEQAAARDLTEYLLSLGHRRFGFIKGHPNHAASQLRLQGFLAALSSAGIEADAVRLQQGYFTYRSGLEAAERLLADEPYPTAIFAGNDDMAAAAVSLAHRIGFEVPEDLSIVGFDDTPIAANVWPALTTVNQPVAAMARAAVDLVLEEVRRQRDGTGAPRQLLHPHTLIVRESTGPAPAEAAAD
ncbi:MAG TPA: LacI family DNA-binding transcriptional regulator [Steroidobacteraceae bacterium]|jgi:LacI family transcriptional regulator